MTCPTIHTLHPMFTKTAKTVSFFLLISLILVSSALAARGPRQPAEGPGGADYAYSRVISSVHGSGDLKYYLYEPSGPKPTSAPLIVFTHGWGATNPSLSYGAWINHLVKKGNIVVYPVYQSMISMLSGLKYTSNCVKSIKDAIKVLQSPGHVRPELDKFATVGHSVGGVLAANIAAVAQKSGLPSPKAVMSVQPGKTPMPPLENLSLIPSDTLLLTLVGDKDTVVGSRDAERIFTGTPQIPLENKDFVIMRSDASLTADHFAPTCWSLGGFSMANLANFLSGFGRAGSIASDMTSNSDKTNPDTSIPDYDDDVDDDNEVSDPNVSVSSEALSIPGFSGFGTNALDYYGTWKLFDALTDAAFYNENREYALGNTDEQRYMGKWSNGTPVKELIVTDDPKSMPSLSIIGGLLGGL